MKAVLKLFKGGSEEKKKNGNHYLDVGEIGMPTQVSHNFSGRVNPDGSIEGIPESWKQRLKLMITVEEATNPETQEKAQQLCKWIDTRAREGSEEFMRVNSDSSPNNSMVSETNTSSADMSIGGEERGSLSEVPEEEQEEATCSRVDNRVLNAADQAVCDNEIPTMRRKKKERTTRQGPRVTRNLSEEQVIAHLQDACMIASPWTNYAKVGQLAIGSQVVVPDREAIDLASLGREARRRSSRCGVAGYSQDYGGEGGGQGH